MLRWRHLRRQAVFFSASNACVMGWLAATPHLPCDTPHARAFVEVLSDAVGHAPDLALRAVRAGCALLFRGPWAAVRRGRSGRAAGVAMEGNAFSRGQEPARKARHRLTDFPSMDGRKAPTGVAFSFGYFSLGHAREK